LNESTPDVAEGQSSFETELIARIGWLIQLRWLAVVGTAAAVGAAALWFHGELATGLLLAVTGTLAVYNLLLYLNLRSLRAGPSGAVRLRNATTLASIQIVLDLVVLAALIHFAGGVESPLALFFVFHVIIASILLERRMSYLTAALAALLYGGVALLEYAGVAHHYHLPYLPGEYFQEVPYLLISVGLLALTLVLVAYLTSSISMRLRERDRELLQSNVACELRSHDLSDLNEQLRRMDAERTRFMLLVTHELRAPISTIYSSLELVRAGYTSPQETQDMLLRAQNRASDLLELIGDLLNLSKIREQVPRREAVAPIQLGDILRDVVEFVGADARRSNVSLDVDIPPDLAPVRAPPDQMKLVWTNLLSNAIKYNQPGGSVHASLRQDAAHVIGVVRDTGIGIPGADLPHMFEQFYRADNAKLVSPHGTGVGLALVRRIVENWGGTIQVESEPGQGTAFTFTLPQADAP
jgi:signal transduction histidine kinase